MRYSPEQADCCYHAMVGGVGTIGAPVQVGPGETGGLENGIVPAAAGCACGHVALIRMAAPRAEQVSGFSAISRFHAG